MISIKTPQPDLKEVMVCVPADAVLKREANGELTMAGDYAIRDATPADLERAGWVRVEAVGRANSRAERAERERDEARRERDELLSRLDVFQHESGEFDEDNLLHAAAMHNAAPTLIAAARERDEARALASAHARDLDRATDREDGVAAERARIVAWLRAVANSMPTRSGAWDLPRKIAAHLDIEADRIERGDHAKGEAPAVEPGGRATDEELFRIADAVYSDQHHGSERSMLTAVARAVAARVRRERDIIARCVEAGVDVRVLETRVGSWHVTLTGESDACDATVAAADVPATLARLLGEVTR